LDLRNGTGGNTGECEYRVPGITVTSSAKVCNNQNYYYMDYMFQGDPAAQEHTSYWLGVGGENDTLEFCFECPRNVAKIRVCATAHPGFTDRRSDYQISVRSGTRRIDVTDGFVNTGRDEHGSWHTHHVQEQDVSLIHFDLKKCATYTCSPCLKKVEIWTVE
jgi:hypothetical protein